MAKKEDELNFETDNNKMASSEKLKALQAAMDKIEKSFGKGSIMKMGEEVVEQVEFMVRNHPVKRHWPSTPLQKHKKPVELPLSLMRNMLLTASMRLNWE